MVKLKQSYFLEVDFSKLKCYRRQLVTFRPVLRKGT